MDLEAAVERAQAHVDQRVIVGRKIVDVEIDFLQGAQGERGPWSARQ